MVKRELFKIDFCKIVNFDCKCGRRYINTSNCMQCTDSYEKQTNADIIRSMTNEELAKFISTIDIDGCSSCTTIGEYGDKNYAVCETEEDILKWLESEVEA